MLNVLKAARNEELALPEMVEWICDILLQEQAEAQKAKKASKPILLQLVKAFKEVKAFGKAIQACEMAYELSPNDSSLENEFKELSAQYTIKKGGFGDEKVDFIEKTQDKEAQLEQMKRTSEFKDKDFLESEVERSRAVYLSDPQKHENINGYVDAMVRTDDVSYENTAIDVLTKAHRDTGSFDFKRRIGDIKIRQMTKRYRKLLKSGDKEAAQAEARKQLAYELDEYAERVVNYPTDLSLKYELGRRQFAVGRIDDAISSLQQVRRDPARRVQATTLLGRAFASKGWFQEAADQFRLVLENELTDEKSVEILYYYGDVLEKTEKFDEAVKQYSRIAQIDFNYKDVRKRIDRIRNSGKEQ